MCDRCCCGCCKTYVMVLHPFERFRIILFCLAIFQSMKVICSFNIPINLCFFLLLFDNFVDWTNLTWKVVYARVCVYVCFTAWDNAAFSLLPMICMNEKPNRKVENKTTTTTKNVKCQTLHVSNDRNFINENKFIVVGLTNFHCFCTFTHTPSPPSPLGK